ncbi:HRDC domain-containing protein [Bergeyella sp. RCAD1439]|uniref:HRDC domain-containing protein n=1 Tax=Bergeyella anatis TaxID=3113737 RepID=UPI002E19029E|nr:HRDC domain-containing protein [Bergeyella sp. RCAD1439]
MKIQVMRVRASAQEVVEDQKKVNAFLREHTVLKVEAAFVPEDQEGGYWSVLFFTEEPMETSEGWASFRPMTVSEETEDRILMALKDWRTRKAKEQNVPAYCIASNKELLCVAQQRPSKREELQRIKGFGRHKIENYGEEILGLLEML